MPSEAINKADLITIRDLHPDDLNFIFASWLRGLYYGDSWYSDVPKDAFMGHYHTVIDYLIKKPNTIVKIACLREDPSVILGYSVYNENALHWVFCKRNWRNIGIAKDLVPSNLNTATHYTKVGRSIMYRKQWIFNPFIL